MMYRLAAFFIILVTIFAQPTAVFAAAASKAAVAAPKAAAVKKQTRAATVLLLSARELRVTPAQVIPLRIGLKNTGTLAWNERSYVVGGTESGWVGTSTLATGAIGSPLVTGRLEFYDFSITAPDQPGTYTFRAHLLADGVMLAGSEVVIPISVLVDNEEAVAVVPNQLLPEPNIRVSLGKVQGAVLVKSVGDYEIKTLDNTIALPVPSGTNVLWEYDQASRIYVITVQGMTTSSAQAFRLQPIGANGRVVLHDKNDRPAWNNSINYDEYRGALELRWSDKIPGLWVVNELPIEYYLKGLIETGNSEPMELHRAVYTAARTYAYVQLPDGVRYTTRIWDIHAVWDQYYKGFDVEKSNPRGMQAVDDTRGMLVTYEGKPVVTPYFTRSSGRTKGWKEVWGGKDKPWLQPVEAKHDKGKKLWGHGVGMSTQDAKFRAKKDDWTYEQLLKHYYTGVEIQKVY